MKSVGGGRARRGGAESAAGVTSGQNTMSRPDELVIKYGIDLDGSDTDDDDGEAPVGVGGFVEIPTNEASDPTRTADDGMEDDGIIAAGARDAGVAAATAPRPEPTHMDALETPQPEMFDAPQPTPGRIVFGGALDATRSSRGWGEPDVHRRPAFASAAASELFAPPTMNIPTASGRGGGFGFQPSVEPAVVPTPVTAHPSASHRPAHRLPPHHHHATPAPDPAPTPTHTAGSKRRDPPMQTAYAIACAAMNASQKKRLDLPLRPRTDRSMETLTDAQSFHGAAFRPGWGPGGRLVHAGRMDASQATRVGGYAALSGEAAAKGRVHAPNTAVTVERFAPGAGGGDVVAKRSALDVALAHTVGLNESPRRTGPSTPGRESDGDVAMDTSGETHGRTRTAPPVGPHGPCLRFVCDRLELPSLCAQHLSAVERSTTAFGASTTTPPEELAAEVGVWDLLATLFGDGEGCAPRGSAADRHARRAGVGAWLRKQIARDVPAPGDESLSGRNAAGTHVAAGRSVKAVAAAVSARDPRLATLLAQSNAGGKGKELAAAQLRIWRDSPAANYVDAPTRVAFGLLAGDVAPPPPDAAPIAPGNWKANFGLHLWFGHPPTATLARSLEGYLGAVANDTAAFPAAPADTFIDPDAARLKDLCFNILALASGGTVPDDVGVEKTFHPLTYCQGDLTNVSLAWHLFVTMRAVGALGNGDKIAALADEMHVAFAAQLLSAGAGGGGVGDRKRKAAYAGGAETLSSSSMVEWAAFVAMHVEDGPRREALVRWTLHGRCADWCDDEVKTSFLRDTLGVPEHWLEEAKREWFAYNWWENDESAF